MRPEFHLRISFLIFFHFICIPFFLSAQQSSLSLYKKGVANMDQERYYAAIEEFNASLLANPVFVGPMTGMAEAYFFLREYEEALRWINQAAKYEKTGTFVMTLTGRIENALGNQDKAAQLFGSVLAKEPNNVDAYFGLAEIALAKGRTGEALTYYEKALTLSPGNRKALLSLSLIYDAQGASAKADEKIRLALKYYTDNAQVHLFAARHYLKNGALNDAEKSVKTALSLNGDYADARLFYGNLLLLKGDFTSAAMVLSELLKREPDNYLVRYALGVVFQKLGDADKSILNYSQAFATRPDDEISRIGLEELLREQQALPDSVRQRYGDYHLSMGREYEKRNQFSSAMYEYRRGLSIYPSSVDLRLAFARLSAKTGFPAKYLSELRVLIEDFKTSDREIEDEYEIQKSLQEDRLSLNWGIDQFLLKRHMYRIDLYDNIKPGGLSHFGAEASLSLLCASLFRHFENIDVPRNTPEGMKDFASAFRKSRETGSDYFVILNFSENERAFSVSASLYHSGTGNKLRDFNILRTGNGKVTSALRKLADEIHASLQPQGWILERRFEIALVNLGSYDGVKSGDVYYIFRKGTVVPFQDKIGLKLDQKNLLGTLTVTEVDELVASGTIQTDQFFDMINTGDEIVAKTEGQELPPENSGVPVDVLRDVLIIK